MLRQRGGGTAAMWLLAFVALSTPAGAQLAYVGSSGGLTCSHSNNADGSCASSVDVLVNDGTTLKVRFAMNANADVASGRLENDFTYNPRVDFTVNAPGSMRLDVTASISGDLSVGESGCSWAANWSWLTGSVGDSTGHELTNLPLLLFDNLGTPANQAPGEVAFAQNQSGQGYAVSDGSPQVHSLSLSWSGAVVSNSCELALRLGAPNAGTTNCAVCGYPGSPSRTQGDDGVVVTVTATSVCGNGQVETDAGEECDLGAANGHSACSSSCHFACPDTPVSSCRLGEPNKGMLAMSYHPDTPDLNSLIWKWVKGAATDFSDFGTAGANPKRFRLCVWDGAGNLILRPEVERPFFCPQCWKEKAHGYVFRDTSGQFEGITALQLHDGDDGKAKILLKAKGDFFDAQPLPLTQSPGPVTAQLLNDDGTACWGATYGAPAKKQSSTVWKDKND